MISNALYFQKFKVISKLKIKDGEIMLVEFLDYKLSSDKPRLAVCKRFTDLDTYRNEMKVLQEVSDKHDNILKLYYCCEPERGYLFMESCWKWMSLFDYLFELNKKGRSIDHSFLCCEANNLIKALKAIHAAGYVHSDIATKNIFINDAKKFKIADFGGSVRHGDRIKFYSTNYISPTLRNQIKDHRGRATFDMDFWGLGKVIYECLVMESEVDFGKNSDQKSIDLKIRRDLSKIANGNKFFKLIFDLMNQRHPSMPAIDVNFSLHGDKTSMYSGTTESLCSYCKMLRPKEERITFKCLHTMHICCWQEVNTKENPWLCPYCKKNIGDLAIKNLTKALKN